MDLQLAISHADRVIGWLENLPSEEMPPRWMWPHEEELSRWFEQVQRDRDAKYGRTTADDVPMMENELAVGRR